MDDVREATTTKNISFDYSDKYKKYVHDDKHPGFTSPENQLYIGCREWANKEDCDTFQLNLTTMNNLIELASNENVITGQGFRVMFKLGIHMMGGEPKNTLIVEYASQKHGNQIHVKGEFFLNKDLNIGRRFHVLSNLEGDRVCKICHICEYNNINVNRVLSMRRNPSTLFKKYTSELFWFSGDLTHGISISIESRVTNNPLIGPDKGHQMDITNINRKYIKMCMLALKNAIMTISSELGNNKMVDINPGNYRFVLNGRRVVCIFVDLKIEPIKQINLDRWVTRLKDYQTMLSIRNW